MANIKVLSDEEIEFLKKINVDIEDEDLEEKVGDYLTLKCIDENYEPNKEGEIAYSILDKIDLIQKD